MIRDGLRRGLLALGVAAGVFVCLAALVVLPPVDLVVALMAVSGGVAIWLWAYLRPRRAGSAFAREVIGNFFIDIAIPILLIVAVPLGIAALTLDLDERIWQAVLAGVFILTGWLTTAIFADLERRRQKAEKMRDFHKAIFAEIRASLATFWDQGRARQNAARILWRMRADPGFVPFIAHESHDRLFAEVLDEIEALPRQTIDVIVAYYSQVNAMTALAGDLRSEAMQARRGRWHAQLYLDYFRNRERAYDLGRGALDVIAAYAEGGAEAADAALAQLNSPGAARSDRPRETG